MVDSLPGTLTPQQVADFLQVEPQTVWRMIRRGELPAFRVGRVYRITREDFEHWLEERKRTKSESHQSNPT